ncbi:hypothetical protein Taro_011008, partial [Colocasia esculenta]|nr:hypothetical protein [Colocasia esculenta]
DEDIVCYRYNKIGHMKGECPEIKTDKYKKNNKLKKPKAMIATWSDEDQNFGSNSTFHELRAFCILFKTQEIKWVYKVRTQASVGPKTSLISKLRSLAAIHCKWIQDIGCARQEMIGEHK